MSHATIEEDNAAGFAYWLRFWCRVVAALQIVGGLCGIYILAFGSTSGNTRAVFLLAFTLFVAAVWSGVLLMFGKPGGVIGSLVVQAFQIVQVNAAGVLYSFGCGLQLILGIGGGGDNFGIGFNYFFPARFFMFINPQPGIMTQQAFTGLNLVALLSIVCLFLSGAAEKRRMSDAASEIARPPGPDNAWPPAPKS